MGKKDMLASLMNGAGMLPVFNSLRGFLVKEVRILAYHRIYDLQPEGDYQFDRDLVSATRAQFEQQIEHLVRRYTPITFARLLESIDGTAHLPRDAVIVTFDDGFEDNYVNAFPILKKYKVPATIFLATDYVGQPKTFWFDRVVYNLHRARVLDLSDHGGPRIPDFANDREANTRTVLRFLKRIPNRERLAILDRIETEFGDVYPEQGFAASRPMTWDQVREMSRAGIEFGSHTQSHPVLSRLDQAQLEHELAASRHIIEEHTGKPCTILAYPVGGQEEYDERTREVARRVGYRLGVSYRSGTNVIGKIEQFDMRRLHVETYVDRHRFAAMLSLPEIFG